MTANGLGYGLGHGLALLRRKEPPVKTIVDISTWARRPHYEFFKGYDDPFFSLTAEVDCTALKARAKAGNYSVFLANLHTALRAVNSIEAFRLRIEDDAAVCHDHIDVFSTAARPDGTFGFAFLKYYQDLGEFIAHASAALQTTAQATDLRPDANVTNVIHSTTVPWLRFTGITHPKNYGNGDSIPKLSFGKMTPVGDKVLMPVSVLVHHALMDARHVSQFFEIFQTLIDEG